MFSLIVVLFVLFVVVGVASHVTGKRRVAQWNAAGCIVCGGEAAQRAQYRRHPVCLGCAAQLEQSGERVVR